MKQQTINEWFCNSSNRNILQKPKLFKKYFYLNWKNYKNYNIIWTDIKPLNYKYEKKIKLKEYDEEIILIGNIIYDDKEPVSLILDKNSFYTNNVSFLKSHLQKCIRLGIIDKSIITAFIFMENNILEFLRRLPIIIIEDVHIIQDMDIIVWFMIMSDIISIPESFKKWCIYLIKFLCIFEKKNFYNKFVTNNDINYDNLENLEFRNKSTIYSLMIRKSYGGMKGDMLMLNYIINEWIQKLINTDFKLEIINPKNITIIHTLHPDLYELSAVDFHCYPKILDILNNYYPQYNIEIIKIQYGLKTQV